MLVPDERARPPPSSWCNFPLFQLFTFLQKIGAEMLRAGLNVKKGGR